MLLWLSVFSAASVQTPKYLFSPLLARFVQHIKPFVHQAMTLSSVMSRMSISVRSVTSSVVAKECVIGIVRRAMRSSDCVDAPKGDDDWVACGEYLHCPRHSQRFGA